MKILLSKCLALGLLFTANPSIANSTSDLAEIYAKSPMYLDMEISPDGKYLATTYMDKEGMTSVVTLDRKTMKPIYGSRFEGKERPGMITWLNNTRLMVEITSNPPWSETRYMIGRVMFNVDGTKRKRLSGTPAIVHLLPDDEKHILVSGYSTGDVLGRASYSELFKVDIYKDKWDKIVKSPIRGGGFMTDDDGNVLLTMGAVSKKGKSYFEIYQRKDKKWELWDKHELSEGGIYPISFGESLDEFYLIDDKSETTSRLYKYDIKTKKKDLLYNHDYVDIDSYVKNRNNKVIALKVEPDYPQTVYLRKDDIDAQWYSSMEASFKHQRVNVTSTTTDGKLQIVRVSNDWHPGKYYLLDTEHKKLTMLSDTAPWIKKEQAGRTEPFRIKTKDGLSISGYLTLPQNKDSNLPMVVIPHGGPHGVRDYWEYDADVQFLSSQGYAVLRVNYRGSEGYGSTFEKAGYLKWGTAIQNDIIEATQWAVKEGVANKSKVCIYGGSFGGYSAAMSPIVSPDTYACAISLVGVFDLDDFKGSSDIGSWSMGENYLEEVLGEDEDRLNQQSPLFRVNEFNIPIFIAHGGKDRRTPIHQAEEFIEALEERGVEYEKLFIRKEGHGFYRAENRALFYRRLASFLDKHLG